jgi:hypothetical protein
LFCWRLLTPIYCGTPPTGRTNASSWRFKPPKLPPSASKLIPLYGGELEEEEVEAEGAEAGPEAEARVPTKGRTARNKRVQPGGQ